MTTKEKISEYKELRKIEKSKLTPEQKERIRELLKELAGVILRWLLNLVTLGTARLLTKKN